MVVYAKQAAQLCAILKPRVVVPIHYAYTAGPLRDRLLLKYDGTPVTFQQAAVQLAPTTRVSILAPANRLPWVCQQ